MRRARRGSRGAPRWRPRRSPVARRGAPRARSAARRRRRPWPTSICRSRSLIVARGGRAPVQRVEPLAGERVVRILGEELFVDRDPASMSARSAARARSCRRSGGSKGSRAPRSRKSTIRLGPRSARAGPAFRAPTTPPSRLGTACLPSSGPARNQRATAAASSFSAIFSRAPDRRAALGDLDGLGVADRSRRRSRPRGARSVLISERYGDRDSGSPITSTSAALHVGERLEDLDARRVPLERLLERGLGRSQVVAAIALPERDVPPELPRDRRRHVDARVEAGADRGRHAVPARRKRPRGGSPRREPFARREREGPPDRVERAGGVDLAALEELRRSVEDRDARRSRRPREPGLEQREVRDRRRSS